MSILRRFVRSFAAGDSSDRSVADTQPVLAARSADDGRAEERSVVLPHKALPEMQGKVYRFTRTEDCAGCSEAANNVDGGYSMKYYLETVALTLMRSSLAVDEAGYPSTPSVLIVQTKKADIARPFSPYGHKKQRRRNDSEGAWFSEGEFLGRVKVDKKTNLHLLDDFPSHDRESAVHHLEAARKFFDIVIVHPSVRIPLPSSWVTRYYGTQVLDSDSANNQDAESKRTNLHMCSQSLYDAKSLAEQDTNTVSLLKVWANTDSEYARAIDILSDDLARHMLGVQSGTTALDRLEDLGRMRKTLAGKRSSDYEISELVGGGVFLSFATVLFSALAGTNGYIINNDFTNIDLIMTSSVGLSGAIASSYVFWRGFQTWYSTSRINTLKKKNAQRFLESMKPSQLDDVEESVISKSYNRKSLFATKVERLDVNGWASRLDSATPIAVVNERITKLRTSWAEYELDPVKALDYPLMLDATCEQTAIFLQALNDLEYAQRQASVDHTKNGLLVKSLAHAEKAFYVAEANAKKQRLTYLSNDDRKKVAKARKFAEIMKDSGSGTNEKRIAFDRANKALEGVLPPLAPKIIGMIES